MNYTNNKKKKVYVKANFEIDEEVLKLVKDIRKTDGKYQKDLVEELLILGLKDYLK